MAQVIALFVAGAVAGVVCTLFYFFLGDLLARQGAIQGALNPLDSGPGDARELEAEEVGAGRRAGEGVVQGLLLPLVVFFVALFGVRFLSGLALTYGFAAGALVWLRVGFVVGALLPAIPRYRSGRESS